MALNTSCVDVFLFVRPPERYPDFVIELQRRSLDPTDRTAPIRLDHDFAREFSGNLSTLWFQDMLRAPHHTGADVRRLPGHAEDLAEVPELLPVLRGLVYAKAVPMNTA